MAGSTEIKYEIKETININQILLSKANTRVYLFEFKNERQRKSKHHKTKSEQKTCGSVVEYCVNRAKVCGFNSQALHMLTKKVIA